MKNWIPEIFATIVVLGIVFTLGFHVGAMFCGVEMETITPVNHKEGSPMQLEKLYSLLVLARHKKFVEGIEPVVVKIPDGRIMPIMDVHLVMDKGVWTLELTAVENKQNSLTLETIPGPRAVVDL